MATISGTTGSVRTITPGRLHELASGGTPVELIDVRTPAEFQSVHVPIARSVPLDSLDPKAVMGSRQHPDGPLYVICRSGARADRACAAFAAAGYGGEVVNVEGGTLVWEAAGLPVVKGRRALPLDRQVRIAVGLMVLLGCALGALVHPLGYLLAAFGGAGLVFAGVTDLCPLAMTMARMPWNQVKSGDRPTCCS